MISLQVYNFQMGGLAYDTLQILGTFHISSTLGIETIASLIPIHLHLQKLSRRHQFRTSTLPTNYAIKSLLKCRHAINFNHHCLSLENITFKQRLKIKSSIVDANNHLNDIFPYFDSLNSKFSSGSRLIDIFSSHFSFYQADCKDKETKASHSCKLNNIIFNMSSYSNLIIIVSSTSIKNNITISIMHIYLHSNSIKKTLHHAISITSSKAKLFTIKYSINWAIQFSKVSCIIVITNSIYTAHWIFNSSVYPY